MKKKPKRSVKMDWDVLINDLYHAQTIIDFRPRPFEPTDEILIQIEMLRLAAQQVMHAAGNYLIEMDNKRAMSGKLCNKKFESERNSRSRGGPESNTPPPK